MLSAPNSPIPLNKKQVFNRFYYSARIVWPSGRSQNPYVNAYPFRWQGFVLGSLILLLTAALFCTELGRVYTGSINRGRNDSSDLFQYRINPDVIVGFNGQLFNPQLENRWIWPWSTATLLFSLVMFTTGALGIFSGVRQSYTTILTFFICLILSVCLLVFLIATYATILAGWKTIYGTNRDAMPRFVRMDQDFSSGCLALSCALFILLSIGLLVSGRKIQVCREKDYPRPIDNYERLNSVQTPIARPRMPQAPPTPRSQHFREL